MKRCGCTRATLATAVLVWASCAGTHGRAFGPVSVPCAGPLKLARGVDCECTHACAPACTDPRACMLFARVCSCHANPELPTAWELLAQIERHQRRPIMAAKAKLVAAILVCVVSRSISPPWGSIRFRLALRTHTPFGVRAVSQTKSRRTPTRKTLPLLFVIRPRKGAWRHAAR